jgi:recombination protein RecT
MSTMTTSVAKRTEEFSVSPAVKQLRADLNAMQTQFANALPPHIPAARFVRVVMTAIQNNPKLLACDRQSLFNACMRAAQDGLLPNSKKVRNSGALSDWNVQVVQEGDQFDYQLGDDPHILHKPAKRGGRTRKVIAAYSIARFPDGTISREVMNVDQIEDIRKKSKSKKGPWSDPTYYPEMCRKTVARLHSKQLPMSTDLDRLMHRDDELYDFAGAREEGRRAMPPPGSARAVLDHFASEPEQIEHSPPSQPQGQPRGEPPQDQEELPPRGEPMTNQPEPPPHGEPARPQQSDAPPAQSPPPGPPKTVGEYVTFAEAIIEAADDAKNLQDWWNSPGQRRLRNSCGVVRDTFDALVAKIAARSEELQGA